MARNHNHSKSAAAASSSGHDPHPSSSGQRQPQQHPPDSQQPTASSTTKKKKMKSIECKLENGNHVVVGSLDDEDDETELTWRLDARKSLSDWAVVVTTKETGAVQVYNVHKNFLAVGPRKSLYFAREFAAHNKKLQEQQELLQRQEEEKQQRNKARSNSPGKKGLLSKPFAFHSGIEPCEMITRTLRNDRNAAADSVARLGNQMVTKLELPQLAAEDLPQVLDYIYSGGTKLEVNTHNATALHYLADLFEIKPLRRFVRGFWQQDLCVENLCLYYRHAATVGDIPVLRHAQEFCARNIFEIPEDYVVQVLTAIDADFFFHVISHHAAIGDAAARPGEDGDDEASGGEEKSSKALPPKDPRAISSKRLSLIVAVYCNIHRQDLNAPLYLRLVGPDILPEIDLKAAKVLLELEYYICRDKDKLSSLKKRCIKVMSKKWDHACVDSRDFGVVSLPRLGGEALERFVALSFTNAKERLSTLDQIFLEWDKVQAELQRLRTEVRSLRNEKKNFVGEDLFETFDGSFSRATGSPHGQSLNSHLPEKGRAFTDVTSLLSASSVQTTQTKSSGGGDIIFPSSFNKKSVEQHEFGKHDPRLSQSYGGHSVAQQYAYSSIVSGQPPSAASLPAYAEFVKESMPTRVEAIEMARSRQKIALSAYEDAVAKLKHTPEARVAIEDQTRSEWTTNQSVAESNTKALITSPVQREFPLATPVSPVSSRVTHSDRSTLQSDAPSEMQRSEGPQIMHNHGNTVAVSPIASGFSPFEATADLASPRPTSVCDAVRPDRVSDLPASPIALKIAASEQRVASRQRSEQIESPLAARGMELAVSHDDRTPSYHDQHAGATTSGRGTDSPHSNRTAKAKNIHGPFPPEPTMSPPRPPPQAMRHISTGRIQNGLHHDRTTETRGPFGSPSRTTTSRSQEILMDAASTAKSLFSFTKNYIKTSASHFANGHGNDGIDGEGCDSTQPHRSTDSAGSSKYQPVSTGDKSSSSPVSVAVFDAAPSFDVGSLVQEACKDQVHGGHAEMSRSHPPANYSSTSTMTASSIASNPSW